MADLDEVVLDLLKQGFIDEAQYLVEAAEGMSDENQARQVRFFSKALSGTGVDVTTLKLDPKRRVMSFRADGMDMLSLPNLVERVLKRVNSMGNTKYTLGRVKRGYHTVVEIEIGR